MNARKLGGAVSVLTLVSILASMIVGVQATESYQVDVKMTGSGIVWKCSKTAQIRVVEQGWIQMRVPAQLYDRIVGSYGTDEFGPTPFVLTLEEWTLYVASEPIVEKFEFERLPTGDVDGDCDVDILDLVFVAHALSTDVNWAEGKAWNQYNPYADFNLDGKVDVFDLADAGKKFGYR